MIDLSEMTARDVRDSFLTPQELADVRKPLKEASVLPLRVYRNAAYHEREVDAVHRKSWHAVARVDQLPDTGSYATANIVGEPVVVIRDKDGTIRALSNVCRHRGSRLLADCGVAKAIVCPYHTWTYNLDGSLRGAPHMGKVDNFDRKSIRLPEFGVELWNGFVFVNLDADAPPLASQLGDLAEKLAIYDLASWETVDWQVKEANWNWKFSMENFTEAYHHIGVHKSSIGAISPAEAAIYEETNNNYSLFYVNIEPEEGMDMNYPFPIPQGLSDFLLRHSPVFNIYPTFHVVLSGNFALWLRFEIDDVKRHRMVWSWLLPPGSKAHPDYAARMAFLESLMVPVVTEDFEFMPSLEAAAESRAFRPGRYSDQERSVHQMHVWLLDKLDEDAQPVLSAA